MRLIGSGASLRIKLTVSSVCAVVLSLFLPLQTHTTQVAVFLTLPSEPEVDNTAEQVR